MVDANETTPRHVLLAGGGSGGHVFPALAVGEELEHQGVRVTFAGSEHGMEADLVRTRGLAFHPLPARPLRGRGILRQLRALLTVARSTWAARGLIRSQEVRAVVGTGGYASAPAVLGARLSRTPSLLVEPNARAGLANRWLSRWASAAAVAYAETVDELQCAAEVTGVPVRPEFFRLPEVTPEAAGSNPRLLVVGGSQGARQLNLRVPEALSRLERDAPDLADRLTVVHQAGRRQVDEAREAYGAAALQRVRADVVPFLDDMPGAVGEAHLIVSRAGAITLAEIAAAGRASVLVPLALAGGHQVANARLLADAGAARLLEAEGLTAELLAAALREWLGDPQRLAAAGRAARTLAREDAAAAIARRVRHLMGDSP